MSSVVGILRLGMYFIMGIMVLLVVLLYFYLMISKKNKKGTSGELKFNSENFSSEKDEDNDPIKKV